MISAPRQKFNPLPHSVFLPSSPSQRNPPLHSPTPPTHTPFHSFALRNLPISHHPSLPQSRMLSCGCGCQENHGRPTHIISVCVRVCLVSQGEVFRHSFDSRPQSRAEILLAITRVRSLLSWRPHPRLPTVYKDSGSREDRLALIGRGSWFVPNRGRRQNLLTDRPLW